MCTVDTPIATLMTCNFWSSRASSLTSVGPHVSSFFFHLLLPRAQVFTGTFGGMQQLSFASWSEAQLSRPSPAKLTFDVSDCVTKFGDQVGKAFALQLQIDGDRWR